MSVNDLLDYWGVDAATDAVILYVENFGNLRNLSGAARRTSMAKPVITIRPPEPDQVELLRQAGSSWSTQVSELVDQATVARPLRLRASGRGAKRLVDEPLPNPCRAAWQFAVPSHCSCAPLAR